MKKYKRNKSKVISKVDVNFLFKNNYKNRGPGLSKITLKAIKTRNVINPVANEDVRKMRAFSQNQPQFPYWRPHLPVTFRSRDDVTSG